MAQFLTLLSILLLVAVFNPIVCPTSQLYNERRDRAPYIESSDHSQQYVGDSYGSIESRLRKTSAYKDYTNPSYRNQEQLPPPPTPPLSNAHNPPDTNINTSTDSLIDHRIRMVFETNFEPGVHIFNGTVDTSTTSVHSNRENVHYFPVRVKETDDGTNIIECLEGDDSTPERKTYCTKLRNYPDKKRIEQLINEKFPHYKPFFNDDLVLPENISHRMDGPIEEYLCNTRRRTIFPQAGVGDEFDWFFIVNTDEFKQGILIEECVETDEICGEKNGISVPNNYKALCRQQYVYRSLLTYRNASIEKAQFKFPSCCKCVLLSGLN